VQAGRDADACQRLVLDEFFSNDLEDLHGLIRPLDPFLTQIGQFDVLNIAVDCGGRHTFSFLELLAASS
jgi:hypothetical protein